jgi:hypothetical protein
MLGDRTWDVPSDRIVSGWILSAQNNHRSDKDRATNNPSVAL